MRPAQGGFAIALGVTAVIWVSLELRQGIRTRNDAITVDRGSRWVLQAGYVGGAALATLAARSFPIAVIKPGALAAILGLACMWSGIALRFWSFRALGRYFTFTVQTSNDQPVITGGPYRLIRHPGYAGFLVALSGVGFLSGNWLSVVALVGPALLGLAYRIRVEEQALVNALGDGYRDYAATHKRLIPFVW